MTRGITHFRAKAPNRMLGALSFESGNGGSLLWWERYKRLQAEFKKHGSLDKRFTDLPKDLQTWRINTLEAKRKGHLNTEQINALNDINFFKARKGKGPKRSGERLDRTIALYQRQGPLTQAETFELHKNLGHYKKQYEEGALSSTSAQKLGITNPYDLVPDI